MYSRLVGCVDKANGKNGWGTKDKSFGGPGAIYRGTYQLSLFVMELYSVDTVHSNSLVNTESVILGGRAGDIWQASCPQRVPDSKCRTVLDILRTVPLSPQLSLPTHTHTISSRYHNLFTHRQMNYTGYQGDARSTSTFFLLQQSTLCERGMGLPLLLTSMFNPCRRSMHQRPTLASGWALGNWLGPGHDLASWHAARSGA